MKKILLAGLACGVVMFGISGVTSATTITFDGQTSGNNYVSPYASASGSLTETFDHVGLGAVGSGTLTGFDQGAWSWSGSASVVNGSSTGTYSAPMGVTGKDTTNYMSVPNPNSSGSVTLSLGQGYGYFGFWSGSLDRYNSISFYLGGTQVDIFTGAQLAIGTANGDQTSFATNHYISFYHFSSLFDTVVFSSNGYAMEFDEVTAGAPVPEPATMLLMGTGLAGLIAANRRRKANKS